MSLEQELLPCAGKNLHSARPEAEKLPLCGSYSGLDAVQAKLLPESGSNSPSDISERDFFLQQEATARLVKHRPQWLLYAQSGSVPPV